jgi:hypothetical protein
LLPVQISTGKCPIKADVKRSGSCFLGQPLDTPKLYFMYTKMVCFDHSHQMCWCARVCTPRKLVYIMLYPK